MGGGREGREGLRGGREEKREGGKGNVKYCHSVRDK